MNDLMSGLTDVNGDQGHVIAAAMREVAEVDGMHPAEAQLINQFVGGLPPLEGNVDISLLDTEELRPASIVVGVIAFILDRQLEQVAS